MADTNIKFYDSTGAAITVLAKDIGGGLYSLSVREADLSAALGAAADASASTDTGTFSLVALIKRLLAKFTSQLPASLGQKAMAASMAVVVANDQTAVPISAVSLPLPTSAATETTLAATSAKLPETLGQKTMANALAVSIASDQSAVTTSNQNNASFAAVANYSVTTTAAAVGGSAACRSVIVKAATANTVAVLVGDATTQAYPLAAGEFVVIPTSNVNTVYAKTASGTATLHVMKA